MGLPYAHWGTGLCLKDPSNSPELPHNLLIFSSSWPFASTLAESTYPSVCSCLHLASKLLWPLLILAMLRLSSLGDILWFFFDPSILSTMPPSQVIPNSEWLPGPTVLLFSLLSFLDFSFSPENKKGLIVGLGFLNHFSSSYFCVYRYSKILHSSFFPKFQDFTFFFFFPPDLPIFKFRSITSALNTGIILTPEARVLRSSLAPDIS